MNKNFCLLVLCMIVCLASAEVQVAIPKETTWWSFFTNYFQNQLFFSMRLGYDLLCFSIGVTYVFWYNDGGANFYKCYNSVPKGVTYL